jgi:hypothetical protein
MAESGLRLWVTAGGVLSPAGAPAVIRHPRSIHRQPMRHCLQILRALLSLLAPTRAKPHLRRRCKLTVACVRYVSCSLSYFLFNFSLMCRTKAGISQDTAHDDVFRQAMQWSNIVSLDESKPHLLPPGMTFFRVIESHVGKRNVLVDKYVLCIQVYNPDSLTTRYCSSVRRQEGDNCGNARPRQVCP